MKLLVNRFMNDLRDLYFFYYFASFGLGAQRDQFIYSKKITQNALEKEYGTSQSYVNTKTSYLTISEKEYPFEHPAKSALILSLDDLIGNSISDGKYYDQLRENLIVLLAELWERKFRVILEGSGQSVKSNFWGSVVRLRNCILHNNKVLDRNLYDNETFNFLAQGNVVSFTAEQINRIIDKAFKEIEVLTK